MSRRKFKTVLHYGKRYHRHWEKPCKCNKNTHLYWSMCFASTLAHSFCPAAISLSSCTSSVIFLFRREVFTPLTIAIILPFCKGENNTLSEFSPLSLHINFIFGACSVLLCFPATGPLPMLTEVNTTSTTASTSSEWTFLTFTSSLPFLSLFP